MPLSSNHLGSAFAVGHGAGPGKRGASHTHFGENESCTADSITLLPAKGSSTSASSHSQEPEKGLDVVFFATEGEQDSLGRPKTTMGAGVGDAEDTTQAKEPVAARAATSPNPDATLASVSPYSVSYVISPTLNSSQDFEDICTMADDHIRPIFNGRRSSLPFPFGGPEDAGTPGRNEHRLNKTTPRLRIGGHNRQRSLSSPASPSLDFTPAPLPQPPIKDIDSILELGQAQYASPAGASASVPPAEASSGRWQIGAEQDYSVAIIVSPPVGAEGPRDIDGVFTLGDPNVDEPASTSITDRESLSVNAGGAEVPSSARRRSSFHFNRFTATTPRRKHHMRQRSKSSPALQTAVKNHAEDEAPDSPTVDIDRFLELGEE
jgi:hypothetical protein